MRITSPTILAGSSSALGPLFAISAMLGTAPARSSIHMRVNAIESTPSPTSFIFKTDEILDERLTDLQGTTYRAAAQTARPRK